MSWVTVREAVRVAVASCLGVATDAGGPVEWVDRALANRWTGNDGEPWADLRLSPKAQVAQGETRYAYDSDNDVMVEYRIGWRNFTVTVLVQTESQEPGENAVDLASNLQTRLRHSSILAGLQAARISLIDIGPAIDATYTDSEGRAASQAAVELFMATVEEWTPTVPSGDFFTTVSGAGLEGSDLAGVSFGPVSDPSSLQPIQMWLRADTNVTTVDGYISAWSTIGETDTFAQSTPSLRPPLSADSGGNLNSEPSMNANDPDVLVSSAAAPSRWAFLHDGSPWTVIVPLHHYSPSHGTDMLLTTGGDANDVGVQIFLDSSHQVNATIANGSGTYHIQLVGPELLHAEDEWFAVRYDGSEARVDASAGSATVAAVGSPSSSDPLTTLMLAGDDCYIPEIVVYSSYVSDDNLAALVTNYLVPRYGVAA